MKSDFAGFPKEAIQFLADLEANNNRDWFQPRKEFFEQKVRDPMLALVDAINGGLARYAPEYVTDPKKAVFRIYRDTRFSADKKPYKTHLAASFGRRGMEKLGGAGFYFSVSHKAVEAGGGIYHPPQETLLAVRTHIATTHAELRKILGGKALRSRMGELQGEELSRAPKGFDPEHPAMDLIRKKDWVLFTELESGVATTRKLASEIGSCFEAMVKFLEYLNGPLISRQAAKSKVML